MLRSIVGTVRAGRSATLVVRGPLGVGKTRLLAYLEDSGSGCVALHASGAESEMELAYSGLQMVVAPLQARVGQLPARQQDALAVAMGQASGQAPDRFLVGLAVLNLMAAAAEAQPLLVLIDDAQWLDRASLETFGFVARRLEAEAVGLVFGLRDPVSHPELDGLPTLTVTGLGNKDAHTLLTTAVPGRMDQQVRDRIIAESRGVPLALLELPRGLSQVELAGGYRTPSAGALVSRIERSYQRRLAQLPAATRLLLLLASAEPVGQVALLWRSAARLGVGVEAAAPAVADGLLEIDARVRFAHPLLRSVIYREADLTERQAVHRVLAEETDGSSDPDRRAWHRAQAATGPDEEVAAELEWAAGRAQARGGLAAAAAFLDRASTLTPDPERRTQRMLSAARAHNLAGAPEEALNLLGAIRTAPLTPLDQARSDLLRGQSAFGSTRDALPLLLRAARKLEPLDSELAGTTYLEALSAILFAGRLAPPGVQREVAMGARHAVRLADQSPGVRLLLEGLSTRLIDGYAEAAPILKEALWTYRNSKADHEKDLRWLYLASWIAMDLWDDESWHDLADRQLRLVRESGAISLLPVALCLRSRLHVAAGELSEGESLIAESEAATDAMQSPFDPLPKSYYVALRARYAHARRLLDSGSARQRSSGGGNGISITAAAFGNAVLANGTGRFDEALEAGLLAVMPPVGLGWANWALPEVIEAGTRSSARPAATTAMQQLAENTRAAGTDWALGIEARSRALLSSGAQAETLFQEAIDRLGRTPMRVDLARAHLLYGEWLRRDDRRKKARERLQTAYDMFTAMRVEGFAARAARELEAADGVARETTTDPAESLTAQELQVATLARDGYTNPEIGTRLFISPRTVEWHMSKVFAKLGITTRRALRDALPRPAE